MDLAQIAVVLSALEFEIGTQSCVMSHIENMFRQRESMCIIEIVRNLLQGSKKGCGGWEGAY
jgi:hypothetical protein